jgi:hypothetical protein
MQFQNDAVVDLNAYRQRRTPESNEHEESDSDAKQLINEIAYHLLKAIQAVKKLPH